VGAGFGGKRRVGGKTSFKKNGHSGPTIQNISTQQKPRDKKGAKPRGGGGGVGECGGTSTPTQRGKRGTWHDGLPTTLSEPTGSKIPCFVGKKGTNHFPGQSLNRRRLPLTAAPQKSTTTTHLVGEEKTLWAGRPRCKRLDKIGGKEHQETI